MSRIVFPAASTVAATGQGMTLAGFARATWGGPAGAAQVWAQAYEAAYRKACEATGPSRFQKSMEPCWN